MSKLISLFLIAAIVGYASQISLHAQSKPTKQEEKAAKVKEKIKKFGTGEKAYVKVTLYSGTTYQGNVSESSEDGFVVVDKAGTSHNVKYSDVNKIGGKNMSTGAKIGIGIAIGAGATILIILAIIASLED